MMIDYKPEYITEQEYIVRLKQKPNLNQSALKEIRNLNVTKPIRITWDSTQLSNIQQSQKNFCIQVINSVQNYFTRILKVNPINTNNVFASNSKCSNSKSDSFSVPKNDQHKDYGGNGQGIPNSDFHIYLTSIPNNIYQGDQTTYAWAIPCITTNKGPIFGRINFNPDVLQSKSSSIQNNDVFEYWTQVIIHEMIHVLGFSVSRLSYWVDPSTGTFHTNESAAKLITYQILGEINTTIIQSPNVSEYAKFYFNCSEAQGLPLENEGYSNNSLSHFQRVVLGNECMTALILNGDCYFTSFSLQILKDTNYYALVEEDVYDTGVFGIGQGCDFLDQKCNKQDNGILKFSEYCSTGADQDENMCGFSGYGGGYCGNDDALSNNQMCLTVVEPNDQDCRNPMATGLQNYLENFGDRNSRCFISDFVSDSDKFIDSRKYRCFNFRCNESGQKLTIIINGKDYLCDQTGIITPSIQGYKGQVKCPQDIRKFCDSKGRCTNRCSQNGICIQNICYCNPGYGGNDCSVQCDDFVYHGQCVSICPKDTVAGPDRNCIYNAPFGFTQSGNNLIRCNQKCRTCDGPTEKNCLTCQSNSFLQNRSCLNLCTQDFEEHIQQCNKGFVSDGITPGCRACKDQGLFFLQNQCLIACPSNYQAKDEICVKIGEQ